MRRIFLDENVDPALARLLSDHICESVRSRGWFGVSNGELLCKIEGDFDVLISHDKGLAQQQNWKVRKLGLVVIEAMSTRVEAYEDDFLRVKEAVANITNGQVIHLNLRKSTP